MAPRIEAIAFVSVQNHPILIRTYATPELKYHYLAHMSLDIIEERRAYG
jgi:trafficking protein particle complex subunit 2